MTHPPELPDEPVEPGPPAGRPAEESRRYPSTIGGAIYLAVLATATVALVIVMNHDWRLGVKVLAAALGAAGVLRLLLPQKDAGMLAVRPRWLDVVMLLGVALALYFLAGDIPDQPPL